MRGVLVFNTRSQKIGWNSGPKYRKNSSNSESIVMSSFTQGLEILLQQLRSLDCENRPRVDQSNLDRIERLKIALAEYLRSETTVGTSSRSSVTVEQELDPTVDILPTVELVPANNKDDQERRLAALREPV